METMEKFLCVTSDIEIWKNKIDLLDYSFYGNSNDIINLYAHKFKYYMTSPVGLINNMQIIAKSYKFNNYDEIIDFLENTDDKIYPLMLVNFKYKVEDSEFAGYIFRYGKI